ncbi:hemerythrin domain-containing protein [bacterium]|nr:hemerythrin domain-containing protein [bacterium]
MDIYSYLKKDHRAVAKLMEELLATKDVKTRRLIFTQIKQELTLHADSEEATFYNAIEKATRAQSVQEQMEHADEEHDEIREYLEKLSNEPMESESWIEMFGEFKHSVTHHVDEEENDVFEKAKKYLSDEQATQLAKEMDAMKKQMMKQKMAA